MIITIDGPSGSGKSSVSQALSQIIGYFYLNTGALYRSIAYHLTKKNIDPENEGSVVSKLRDIVIEIKMDGQSREYQYMLNGTDITSCLGIPAIARFASIISQYRDIRDLVRKLSHDIAGKHNNLIAEGRDAGTALFPDSPIKLYLTASPEERAKRRQKDYQQNNINKDLEDLIKEINERDQRDSGREIDPLKISKESILIDTTELSFSEVINKIINIIKQKINDNGGLLYNMDNNENKDILKENKSDSDDINKNGGIEDKDKYSETEASSANDDIQKAEDNNEDKTFAEMIEDYDTNIGTIKAKQIVKGKIIRITDSDVFIDIGFKSEGILPITEFSREQEIQDENFREGGEVSVYVEKTEDEEGNLKISKYKADRILLWDRLKETEKENGSVQGKVIQHSSNGGLVIDIGVLSGFIPAAHKSYGPEDELPLGAMVKTKILTLEPDKKRIILSRRLCQQEEVRKQQKEVLDQLYKGQLVKAIIKKVEPDHLIAEVEGITAFMHKKEMSWGRIEKPSDLFEKGQEIEAIIKSINKKKNSIRISYKDKTADPWTLVNTKYSTGQRLTGKVMSIKPYGLFVQLEPGVEGLIHVSELSWDKVQKNADNYANLGDDIEFEIIDINTEDKRVSLSLKTCLKNPWESFSKEHPVNSVISGPVNSITDFGIFIKLNDDIDGLIHQSEISWEDNNPDINSLYKIGDIIEAKVIDINIDKKRVSLSIKQLEPNPVNVLFEKFKTGDVIQGKVVQWEDFGCFVNISNNVDGLLHISQIPNGKRDIKPKKGDIIEAEIIKLDKKGKKLSLSIWELFKKRYRENHMIEGKVVAIPEKGGAFIEIMPCVDTYIKQSELTNESIHLNDTVKAVITKIDRDNKLVYASAKRIESKKEEEAYKNYVKKTQEEQKSFKNTVIPQNIAQMLLKDTQENDEEDKDS